MEIALNALGSLNASGKMIGSISHVEAMQERIPAQIRMEKGGGGVGHSRLWRGAEMKVRPSTKLECACAIQRQRDAFPGRTRRLAVRWPSQR